MSSKLPKSHELGAKAVYASLLVLKENDRNLSSKDVRIKVEEKLKEQGELNEYTNEILKGGFPRWEAVRQFFCIEVAKVGYLKRENRRWYLTQSGEDALDRYKENREGLFQEIRAKYREWQKNQKSKQEANEENEKKINEDDVISEQVALLPDRLEEDAEETIVNYIKQKDGYEMEKIVKSLLVGMGYHIAFTAQKGQGDGGVDIMAYGGPLGTPPRIKVQVKHKSGQASPPKEIRELNGILGQGEIGVFVSTAGFSSEAKNEAKRCDKPIELIDLDKFIDLWKRFYPKMNDEGKSLIPLKSLYYIDTDT